MLLISLIYMALAGPFSDILALFTIFCVFVGGAKYQMVINGL